MAISSYQCYLMKGTTSGETTTWSKLVDIKDFPDLGGAPEMLETTTLSDSAQTFIAGIQKLDAMEFTANYTSTDYTTVKALAGTENDYAVWFGATSGSPSGANGKYKFRGMLDVYITGGGVNEVVEMKISIAPSTVITADT